MDFENFILFRFLYQSYLSTDIINYLLSIIRNLINTTPCFVCKNSEIHNSEFCYLEKYNDKNLIFDDHYTFSKYENFPIFRPQLYHDKEIVLVCGKIYGTLLDRKVKVTLNYRARVYIPRNRHLIELYRSSGVNITIHQIEVVCNNNIYCVNFDNLYAK